MTHVLNLSEIESVIPRIDLVQVMEEAFIAYSSGRAVVPPVGELLFDDPPGEAHIKYGYLKNDSVFVIKIATGFYRNAEKGLPPNSGLVLVFDQSSGMLLSVLLDEGLLTNLRTAAAGAVAAKHLAVSSPEKLCVLGAGTQARLQLHCLKGVTSCRRVSIWARRSKQAAMLASDLTAIGFETTIAPSPAAAARNADIIISTTASTLPLLGVVDVKPGAHITAVGSDTPHKQELEAELVARADVLVADSRSQCMERGEIHHAITARLVAASKIVELGDIVGGRYAGRTNPREISLVDLTGVAVQDIAIAKAVLSCIAKP